MAASRAQGAILGGIETFIPPRRSRWKAAGQIARDNPLGVVALVVIIVLALGAIFAGTIAPYGETAVFTGPKLDGPSADHLLGTDRIGRDQFSRLLYGARVSLTVGFISVAAGTLIGAAIGLISGYAGGWLDNLIQRLMEMVVSIPALLLAIVFVTSFGPGIRNAMIAIAIVLAPTAARVMRSVVLQVKARPYIEAAQASGASNMRVLMRYVVPNAVDEVLILASVALGGAIIIEAALAFLGLGAQAPAASWGSMLADGRVSYEAGPHLVWAPALFISVTVLAVTMLGDTIRDVLDPKVRGRGKVDLN